MDQQKLVVFGGRDFTSTDTMHKVLFMLAEKGFINPTATLICGMARGADMTAHGLWTRVYGLPVECFHADWDNLGRSAGFIRNSDMAKIADVGVGFWDGKSRGTKHMIETMNRLNKPLFVHQY